MNKHEITTELRALIDSYGGQTAFARTFDIALRTVQSWYLGERTPPGWVVKMIKKIKHAP